MSLRAVTGICLIQPITTDSDSPFNSENKGRIKTGKVISCGEKQITEFGGFIECPCKVGDTVYYLSYEGGYDSFFKEGKEYVCALFKDVRLVVEEDK